MQWVSQKCVKLRLFSLQFDSISVYVAPAPSNGRQRPSLQHLGVHKFMITYLKAHYHAFGQHDNTFRARDHALECVITRPGCVITRSYASHAVFLGPVRALLGVLFRVLGPSRCVFEVCFANISFHFLTKLNPDIMR